MPQQRDLRTYIADLDALGDLQRIDVPVSADLEAAAIARLSTEHGLPAPLFEQVKDGSGCRLMGAPGAFSSVPGHPFARAALSLGLPADTTARQLVDHLVAARHVGDIPPKVVDASTAPCKENVLRGANASLGRFPIPRIHQTDGAPYVNTWGVIIAQTPDGRWTNAAITRIMMLDEHTMTGLVLPAQHLGMVWQEWEALGQRMPYALVQGGDPGVPFVGAITLPAEQDELAYLGALHGSPVEVVRCETNNLLVPASAEVVIEGHLSPARDAVEGPFAEFHGWAMDEVSNQPIFTVEAITFRNDPIWPIAAAGRPVDDSHLIPAIGMGAELVTTLREADLPVTTAWVPLSAACHWSVITVPASWRDQRPGVSSAELVCEIGEVLSHTRVGRMSPAVYVFDDDIDPANDSDLLWAMGTRVHPSARQDLWDGPIMPWYPCFTEEERHSGHGQIVVHDALLPAFGEGRSPSASFAEMYPEAVRRFAERTLA